MAPFELGGTGPDFVLFRNGPVTLVHREEVLDDTLTLLTDLGYLVPRFDARAWADKAGFASAVKQGLGFPDHFGGNLDAFDDSLREVALGTGQDVTGLVLVFTGYDAFAGRDPRTAQAILDIVADVARFAMLFGRRLACLVQSDDPGLRFGPVGATPVGPQS
ncbi:barstar family protein [Actinophytocola glycyrrhizae]|uniref:Barstar family protein n=1 Tax=Actinophytocola glycyrrhizae TaxID=2044873 RepID=A0ABV9SB80_9PSEU